MHTTRIAVICAALGCAGSLARADGTWSTVTSAPTSLGTMELLSDGTVIAQASGVSKNWYKLTPSSTGSYATGTWSTIASMNLQRLYTATNILQNGNMFVLGGEYSGSTGSSNWTNTGEIYNPVANTWTSTANHPESQFGDVPTAMLPDGRVLAGSLSTANTYIYNPTTNVWSTAATKLHSDRSDEESWVKLPDDSILSYDVFGTVSGVHHAQRYVPSTNTWVDAGAVPVNLGTSGAELGGSLRLADGRVLVIGGNSNTAIYTPSTNTWAAGPVIPGGLGANDAPAAMMPNGKVLLAATTTPSFAAPTVLYEFDPTTDTLSPATTTGGPNLTGTTGYTTRMLVLPSGEVLFNPSSNVLRLYNGNGSPDASWKPTITNVVRNNDGTLTLTGTQLNGIGEGATYGDDAEMSTNFPLIQYTDSTGKVLYARTFNWSSTGVATGSALVTVQFTPPAGIGAIFSIRVIANGIASDPLPYTLVPEANALNFVAACGIGLLSSRRSRRPSANLC